MLFKNTETQFGSVAKWLHWIMALIVIGLIIVGLYMTRIPISAQKLKLYGLHKEIGILVLTLAMVRIVWRLSNINPRLPDRMAWWEKFAARAMHWAFYGFLFALPITGWMMTSASGLPVSFFGLFVLPNLVSPNDALRHILLTTHHILAYGLIIAFCGHVAAALKHHFIDKDDILRRML